MQDNLEIIAGYLCSELKALVFKLDPLTTRSAQKAIRAYEDMKANSKPKWQRLG